jgi:hypothetical protein
VEQKVALKDKKEMESLVVQVAPMEITQPEARI